MIILVALGENVDDDLRLESQPPPRAPLWINPPSGANF